MGESTVPVYLEVKFNQVNLNKYISYHSTIPLLGLHPRDILAEEPKET